jgi:uncharacterized protein YukE
MATYAVNMSNVQEVAAQMGVLGNYINNLLDQLDNGTLQNLAEWNAESRAAYETAKKIWTQKASDMGQQATIAQNALGQIHDNYANAEFQGLGLWGG